MNEYIHYKDSEITVDYQCDNLPKRENFKMHTHERYEFYYFINGKGSFKVEGSCYPLERGDILLMGPTESHYIDLSEEHPYTRLTVHFSPKTFMAIDTTGELLKPFVDREAGRLNLYRANDFATDSYQLFIKNILATAANRRLQTLANLLPLLNEISLAFRGKIAGNSNDSMEYQLVRYINRNLTKPLTLDNICSEFYISKSQLCRLFKSATGSTVWDYIIEKRLVNARRQLQEGMPPTKVCEEWGFRDYSSFYRAFRKKYGISPGQL